MPFVAVHRTRSIRPQALLLVLLLACGLVGLWVVDRAVETSRAAGERAALRVTEAAVQAVRQRLERSLEAVASLHAMARYVRLDLRAEPLAEPSAIESYLVKLAREGRFGVLQVAIIDADGMLIWSTVPGVERGARSMDLADRTHFRVHRDGWRDPYVSSPLVGRASGRWSVQVTRPLLDETGGFLGVVVVSIDPLDLGADLENLDFAPGAVATLLRQDGIILTRSDEPVAFMGRSFNAAAVGSFATRPSGSGRVAQGPEGGARLCAWQRIPDWPLVVVFELDETPIAEAAVAFRRLLLLVLLAVLTGLGAAGLLGISWFGRLRERAEVARLHGAAQEVRTLLEALPGAAYRGQISATGEYRRRHLSSGIVQVSGWPLTAFESQDFYAGLMAPGETESRAEFLRRVFRLSDAVAEYRIRSAAGPWVWVRDHCRVVRFTDGGDHAEVVGLIIDITSERQLKAQAFATAKLATLGEMATGLAHELNQPSASITLAADVAAFEIDRAAAGDLDSARGRLDDIARQAMRMREVIDHFQVFGRMGESKEGVVGLQDVVSGALKIGTGMLKAAGIGVTTDLPEALPPVCGQLVPLEQVMVNLLVNARDAMAATPPDLRSIAIAARPDAAASQLVLTVRDHGHGLAPEHAGRLFEPFFTTKPVGYGTGLGLAIAYGTIRGFGGSIAIENHPEGGAVVIIRLNQAATGAVAIENAGENVVEVAGGDAFEDAWAAGPPRAAVPAP
ncbi:ATP-binding protein [Falsiroseomonas selenitidurans]|uniref:histidine kinase n=1 Tax=Falsiroseomonas selenitidurans TaxID=2716335 RepID=A0ABX1E9D7_9PROT|nr:ATP-binding protein [Falsiroseomonas selenitidurans]NKC33390.1 hypothetical protein [Falsiroseomonas selenitidurans]